jgi:hypothetical protein
MRCRSFQFRGLPHGLGWTILHQESLFQPSVAKSELVKSNRSNFKIQDKSLPSNVLLHVIFQTQDSFTEMFNERPRHNPLTQKERRRQNLKSKGISRQKVTQIPLITDARHTTVDDLLETSNYDFGFTLLQVFKDVS